MFKRVIVCIFFLSVGLIYLHNLTRDIYSGDIGDLVTAAYVGGVPHAPGYPLFTLLGYILAHLPIPLPIVSRVGLISVFSSILGLIIFYKFSIKVTRSVFLSLLSTSILAFSYLWWLSAEIPEVFALNNLFATSILYLTIKFYEQKKAIYLFFLTFLAGLSLTHHFTIILIFPSVLVLTLKHVRFIFSNKRFIWLFLLFILGLSVYIYIPIAASRNPVINWDNASNLKNFIHLVTRKDYGVAPGIINSIPVQVKLIHVWDYFKTIVSVFSYQILFLIFLGFIYLLRGDKRVFISLLLAFLLSGAFSVFYAASLISTATAWGIIERFYTLSSVILMFSVPYGLISLKKFLDTKFSKPIYSFILLSYFLIIPLLLLKYNFPRTDLSKTKIGNTLARNLFATLPRNAVLFVSGDNTAFSIWYIYYVLKERQDIDIINPPGVGNNLYLDEEINTYFKKNPRTQLNDIVTETFDEIRKKRRMFTTFEIKPMPKNTILIPKGLVYEISPVGESKIEEQYLEEVESIWRKVRVQRRETLSPSEQNFITPEIPFIYSNGLVHVGDFVDSHYRDPKKAEHYYRRALWIDDTNPQAYSGLALSLYKAYGDCIGAQENIKRAISIYPIWKTYYVQEYFFYKNCRGDKQKLVNLQEKFRSIFNQDIEKQIKSP